MCCSQTPLGILRQVSTREPWYADLTQWIVQWLAIKSILGSMARWKAIYLVNGYDKVWSILQHLAVIVPNSDQALPPAVVLDQDGTIASGNWSVRED